jgi:SAM-dependent methyltransferase
MTKYFKSRFTPDNRRSKVWIHLTRYLQKFISTGSVLLEVGPGYCDFINQVDAKKKLAFDIEPEVSSFANSDIEVFIGNAIMLHGIESGFIDVVFASNFLEHLTREESDIFLKNTRRVLKDNGLMILMQPNYRYSSKVYFDDFTHKTIYSHISIRDYLSSMDFEVLKIEKKFMPFTLKSKASFLTFLVPLYLKFPFKPFAKQMLVISKKITV